MIYTPATVYYRLEPVRGYHLFVFPFLFFPLLSRRLGAFSRVLLASHFLRLQPLADTPRSFVFYNHYDILR